MIDHLLGRPSPSWKRSQVFLVLVFWMWRLRKGDRNGPQGLRTIMEQLKRYTPWQIIGATMTFMYALKHLDKILGLQAPEPLARLYANNYYRATYINTAMDAGFATAMSIRPKWAKDILSVAFGVYYLFFADEGDAKLRKFRAVPTVEMLRTTWEKTANPYLLAMTYFDRPRVTLKKKIMIQRPAGSHYTRPITTWLFYNDAETSLWACKDLILDIPGGGFISMSPEMHEERIRWWTIKTGKPVLSVDYGKAPEYPYPYAIHECLDLYRSLHETKGGIIGFGRGEIDMVVSGDSAGGNIAAAMVIKLLEMPDDQKLPLPIALFMPYPCLDFNFSSWMPPEHLRILRQESKTNLGGALEHKNHMNRRSPLAVVDDKPTKSRLNLAQSFTSLPFVRSAASSDAGKSTRSRKGLEVTSTKSAVHFDAEAHGGEEGEEEGHDAGHENYGDGEGEQFERRRGHSSEDRSLDERVLYYNESQQLKTEAGHVPSTPVRGGKGTTNGEQPKIGTKLTMTSRTSYFGDRIISAEMMRCMAICYIGPRNLPDIRTNYYISPILCPEHILAHFPPVFLITGSQDPFIDDSVLLYGKIREAKQNRKREALLHGSRFGEHSRKTSLPLYDPILDESDNDWVQLRILQGWSHGFFQMLSLLPGVKDIIVRVASQINASFERHELQKAQIHAVHAKRERDRRMSAPAVDHASHGHAFRQNHRMGALGSISSAVEEDEEERLTFTPRRLRKEGSRSESPAPLGGAPSGSITNLASYSMRSSPETVPTTAATSPPSPRPLESEKLTGRRASADLTFGSKESRGEGEGGASVKISRATSLPPLHAEPHAAHQPIVAPKSLANFNKPYTSLINPKDLFDKRRQDSVYGIETMDLIGEEGPGPDQEGEGR